ncbi:receptor tyrosine-protein kinase erbB-2-like isoform X2 [Haliotis rufescens]|uniref:receptor tyrosine-protein kinase erbB-2-like isoform X2 n=1 Tax=Haliotis rufescens TaxID=6454 RepID=UPI00201F3992|nr:receptor tyrosine-protein kinase erbB-2-like isoform X2 [Haliotis rufescens]
MMVSPYLTLILTLLATAIPVTCQIDGGFSAWSEWTTPSCAVTCGTTATTQVQRTRSCSNPPPSRSGQPCTGSSKETKFVSCTFGPCPVHGGFSQWTQWSNPSCAVTCGSSVTTLVQRHRSCNNPLPSFGGSPCRGSSAESAVVNCNLTDCPVHGGFSQWTRWTNPSCAVTCGASATRRVEKTRRCDSPVPSNGGRYCIGDAYKFEDRNCQLPNCQDDVGFNTWGQWINQTCDVTCGSSASKTVTRVRTCMYPSPQNDSGNCTGPFEQTKTVNCNLSNCAVDGGISEWDQWDDPPCPGSCDGAVNTTLTRTRNRTCSNPPPSNGGTDCTEARWQRNTKTCCPESSSSTRQLAVGISVGVAALLGLIVIIVCVMRRRHSSEKEKPFVPARLELITLMGEGKFGEVWKARAHGINSKGQWDFVAVKKCKGNATEAVREDFKHEIELMKSLPKHLHVVNYLHFSAKAGSDMLIMELVPLGNLLNHLRSRRPKAGARTLKTDTGADTQELTSKELTMFAHQIAKGMIHLQNNRIVHRDLAARNVLLGENLVCKVSDLGLARKLADTGEDAYETKSGGPLPIRWMAPESLKDRLFSSKSDVWSFGILLWEIVTLGASPYQGQSARDVMGFVMRGGRMPMPDHCAPELYSLMTKCWRHEQESRPDFKDLSSEVDSLLEEAGDYIKLSDYQDHLYMILEGQSGDAEEKV